MNKDKKVLYFDCETTGVKPAENGLCQLAFLIEIGGEIVEEKDFLIKPFPGQIVEKSALEVNGRTLTELREFPEPGPVHKEIVKIWKKHVDKFDKMDKFYPAGYNVRFDLDFVAAFFERNNDKYFGSWQNWRRIDPLPFLYWMDLRGQISLENYKLETVCAYFGIKIDAHDALSDVRATRELILKIDKIMPTEKL